MAPLDARLQVTTSEYQKIETDLSNAVEIRQKLDAQLSENEQVKKIMISSATSLISTGA
jgi:prefoldin beta subunit